ncbi:hypothetical protein Sjap_021813 [Stephania japonica]|uniref:UDP-glycosyltransferase n=1 Tax=Stephania japonica TaxID=461633 RepID=A0AAP0HTU3_9MAGN
MLWNSEHKLPPVCTIGPLQLLLNHVMISEDNITRYKSIGSNLWEEKELKCLNWLSSKPPNSIVYVNFGSITTMSTQDFIEFASETTERCLFTSWCPQEKVLLSHVSVGAFLTHSGWNTTPEVICANVPMTCWPFFPEQPMNCREDVEMIVREVMEGEKGVDEEKSCGVEEREPKRPLLPVDYLLRILRR